MTSLSSSQQVVAKAVLGLRRAREQQASPRVTVAVRLLLEAERCWLKWISPQTLVLLEASIDDAASDDALDALCAQLVVDRKEALKACKARAVEAGRGYRVIALLSIQPYPWKPRERQNLHGGPEKGSSATEGEGETDLREVGGADQSASTAAHESSRSAADASPKEAGLSPEGRRVRLAMSRVRQGGRLIGKGTYGKIWLLSGGGVMKAPADRFVEDDFGYEDLHAEAELVASLSHPNIVGITEWRFGIPVYAYCEGGDLWKRTRGPVAEVLFAKWMRDVAGALRYLHRLPVIHRDLKPNNVLIKSEAALLGDFGCAKRAAFGFSQVGCPQYLSPEVAEGAPFSPASDVWAFGVTFKETANKAVPHLGAPFKDILCICTAPLAARPSASEVLKKMDVAEVQSKAQPQPLPGPPPPAPRQHRPEEAQLQRPLLPPPPPPAVQQHSLGEGDPGPPNCPPPPPPHQVKPAPPSCPPPPPA